MRIRKYKCPNSPYMEECMFDWGDDDLDQEACDNCGKTYEETRTIWHKIYHVYLSLVPFDWRPKQLCYRLECWVWQRYTTIKPRTLPHTWCDRSKLIPHMMFEILTQFVEKEMGEDDDTDWDATPDHIHARDEIMSLYEWWKTYDDYYPYGLPKEEYEKIEKPFEVEMANQQMLLNNCKRIIDVSPYMWT